MLKVYITRNVSLKNLRPTKILCNLQFGRLFYAITLRYLTPRSRYNIISLHAITFITCIYYFKFLALKTIVEDDYYVIDCVILLIIQSSKAGRNSSSISG